MSKKFNFSYSSPTKNERQEIESIRNQYIELSERDLKLVKLKKLDKKVKRIPTIVALTVGICGILIFGLGLTMVLEWNMIAWGSVVCVVGLAPIISTYFIYTRLTKKLKNKYGKEIVNLSDELLGE